MQNNPKYRYGEEKDITNRIIDKDPKKSHSYIIWTIAFLLTLNVILHILGFSLREMVAFYYVCTLIGLIIFILYFGTSNWLKSKNPQITNSSGNEFTANRTYNYPEKKVQEMLPPENKIITNQKYNAPIKSLQKAHFPSEENLTPDIYEGESFTRLENLKDSKLDSKIHFNNHFEQDPINENVEKGDKFERYVVDRFKEEYFSIVDWTTDMTRKHNRFVESNCNPDLVIRHRESDETFCVECKYRSRLVNGNVVWSYPAQMRRYFSFAQERQIPFFVLLGLAGGPDSPAEVFCVPLEVARNPQLPLDSILKYYHNPREDFLWENGALK